MHKISNLFIWWTPSGGVEAFNRQNKQRKKLEKKIGLGIGALKQIFLYLADFINLMQSRLWSLNIFTQLVAVKELRI
jgi:hypothetical protein